jgi:hypothetical protein
MARYQLRLNLRNGNTRGRRHGVGVELFETDPAEERQRGSQISEQMLFQKLSRTLRRLTNASSLSYQFFFDARDETWRVAGASSSLIACDWYPVRLCRSSNLLTSERVC